MWLHLLYFRENDASQGEDNRNVVNRTIRGGWEVGSCHTEITPRASTMMWLVLLLRSETKTKQKDRATGCTAEIGGII